jgi:hypothetical protein
MRRRSPFESSPFTTDIAPGYDHITSAAGERGLAADSDMQSATLLPARQFLDNRSIMRSNRGSLRSGA